MLRKKKSIRHHRPALCVANLSPPISLSFSLFLPALSSSVHPSIHPPLDASIPSTYTPTTTTTTVSKKSHAQTEGPSFVSISCFPSHSPSLSLYPYECCDVAAVDFLHLQDVPTITDDLFELAFDFLIILRSTTPKGQRKKYVSFSGTSCTSSTRLDSHFE